MKCTMANKSYGLAKKLFCTQEILRVAKVEDNFLYFFFPWDPREALGAWF